MIDFRYHFVTVIGMFLMLTVGLVLGMSLGGPDRRDAAYERLRHDFDLLRTENERVRGENDALQRRREAGDQSVRELLPLAVRDRLAGAQVGVIVCGALDEGGFWSDL